MAWDTTELKRRFSRQENAGIIQFLEREHPSAHSDIASELTLAAKGFRHSRWYCPDVNRYAYVLLHTDSGVIYGLAFGMNALAFRLPQQEVSKALAEGGEAFPDVGNEWVCFYPFKLDLPLDMARSRMRHWCEVAHQYANTF